MRAVEEILAEGKLLDGLFEDWRDAGNEERSLIAAAANHALRWVLGNEESSSSLLEPEPEPPKQEMLFE